MIIIKPRHEETCLTVLSERYHEFITRKKYMYCINNVSITQSHMNDHELDPVFKMKGLKCVYPPESALSSYGADIAGGHDITTNNRITPDRRQS